MVRPTDPPSARTAHQPPRLPGEAARFLVVGSAASLVAVLLFNALVRGSTGGGPGPMDDAPLVAYGLANTVGMVVSYWGVRRWALSSRPPVGRGGGSLGYLLINGATMVIPLVVLSSSRYALGLDSAVADNLSANGIGLALATATRFWALRRFVFRPVVGGVVPAARTPASPHQSASAGVLAAGGAGSGMP